MAARPKDLAVARALADEVQAAEGRRRTWRKVTTLLDLFGVYRLTPAVRERITEALDEVRLVADPPISVVERHETVRLERSESQTSASSGSAGEAEQSQVSEIPAVRSITQWMPGHPPYDASFSAVASEAEGVVWIDIDANTTESPEALVNQLSPMCGDMLTEDMVKDLLTVDDTPRAEPCPERRSVWRMATFQTLGEECLASDAGTADEASRSKAGLMVMQFIELLIGDRWVLSCWHNRRIFRGAAEVKELEPGSAEPLRARVAGRWHSSAGTPYDLAALILDQACTSYATTIEQLNASLDGWELALYHQAPEEAERETLLELRGLLREMRRRLAPMQSCVQRMTEEWPPSLESWQREILFDELALSRGRIEEGLRHVDRLGDVFRSALDVIAAQSSVAQLRVAHEQREQSRRLQDRITLVTALLLVPTLIAGVYGANTELPGRGGWGGFWLMLAAMSLGAILSLGFLRLLESRERQNDGLDDAQTQAAARAQAD